MKIRTKTWTITGTMIGVISLVVTIVLAGNSYSEQSITGDNNAQIQGDNNIINSPATKQYVIRNSRYGHSVPVFPEPKFTSAENFVRQGVASGTAVELINEIPSWVQVKTLEGKQCKNVIGWVSDAVISYE